MGRWTGQQKEVEIDRIAEEKIRERLRIDPQFVTSLRQCRPMYFLWLLHEVEKIDPPN